MVEFIPPNFNVYIENVVLKIFKFYSYPELLDIIDKK